MGIGTGTAALIGGIASAGAGVAGSALQASAAGNAAQAQSNAAARAMGIAGTNLGGAVNAQQAATQQAQGLYSPYIQAGTQGLGSLSQALAPGGTLAQGWNQTFQAPSAAQAAATPGYQFALQQGLGGIQAGAAAQGNLLSGGTQKALANYATGLASQTYQQSYNNALQGYQQNYATWANNQQNLYNRLMGLTGMGAAGQQQYANLAQTGAQNLGGIYNANTAAMAQLLGSQGAAQASGMVGQANAFAGGLNSLAGGVGQGLMGYAMGQQGQQVQQPWADLGGPQYGAYGINPNPTPPTGAYGVSGIAPGSNSLYGAVSQGIFPSGIFS